MMMRNAHGRSAIETGALTALIGLAAVPAILLFSQNYDDSLHHVGNAAANAPVLSLLNRQAGDGPPALSRSELPSALPNAPETGISASVAMNSLAQQGPDPSLATEGIAARSAPDPLPAMGSVTTSAQGQVLKTAAPASSLTPLPADALPGSAAGQPYGGQSQGLETLAAQIATLDQQIAQSPPATPTQVAQLESLVTQYSRQYDVLSQNLPPDAPVRQAMKARADQVYRSAQRHYPPPSKRNPQQTASTASSGMVVSASKPLPVVSGAGGSPPLR
ncbi:MAG: hypothetical protein IPK79_09995 [Vampirovibrionales bacterium]|nr:hypothetical protein [Vampirovibrionales bacterium]